MRFIESDAVLVSAKKGLLISIPEFDYGFKIMGQPTAVTPDTFMVQISEDLPLNKQVAQTDAVVNKGPGLDLQLLKPFKVRLYCSDYVVNGVDVWKSEKQ